MDQTEGPFRARIRLKRCHLNIDSKFLLSDMKFNEGKLFLQPSLIVLFCMTSI